MGTGVGIPEKGVETRSLSLKKRFKSCQRHRYALSVKWVRASVRKHQNNTRSKYSPESADETLNKWMRNGRRRPCLNRLDLQNPQVRLPLFEPKQRTMIETYRNYSVEAS